MRSVGTGAAKRTVLGLSKLKQYGGNNGLATTTIASTSTSGRQHLHLHQSSSALTHLITQHYCTNIHQTDEHQQHHRQQRQQQQFVFTAITPNPSFHPTETKNNNSNDSNYDSNKHLQVQSRSYVTATTPKQRSGATLVLGLGTLAATAKAGQYAVQAYNEWKESQPSPEELAEQQKKEEEAKAKMNSEAGAGDSGNAKEGTGAGAGDKKEEGKRENIFAKMFNLNVGSKYYEGGFDDKMTRKEAALILGVRESSTAKRIKDAHRKLLILNHPDTGGSTYLSGKVNEAKELLLKGKST
eukprot:CAMPEP_0203703044 /NCGR_PEP_ID=MMETSP0091-20130426/41695_1 /ASSEMBLY_ACC=CAM_ASM_001089 /TAXON_ID=426623 /ORGANISM="Chaetoceros affinis, Strain CCMP159" /LENGTH=297 /DNA_ID=CAMNT_0050577477 /DNA_START=39 /DNA_END=935 /DNA_ORIENTATION=+